jgi:hypothetical protein
LPEATFIDGIHLSEEFAEGSDAGGAHALAQLVDGGLDGTFVFIFLARFAVAEIASPLCEVVEGPPKLMRFERMVQCAAAEKIGKLVESARDLFVRRRGIPVSGVDLLIEGLEEMVALRGLPHGALGQEPVATENAGEIFETAAAALALAPALAGIAPFDTPCGILAGFYIALCTGIENTHAAAGQSGRLPVSIFD